jgi:hypothetical protein
MDTLYVGSKLSILTSTVVCFEGDWSQFKAPFLFKNVGNISYFTV